MRSLITIYREEHPVRRCTNQMRVTEGLTSNLRATICEISTVARINLLRERQEFYEIDLIERLGNLIERATMRRV
jgi:hypothetical protein